MGWGICGEYLRARAIAWQRLIFTPAQILQPSDDYQKAYTMWFFDEQNPNDNVSDLLHPYGNTSICNLRYLHKSLPTPEGPGFTECHPWSAGSCCSKTTANATFLNLAYGAGFQWDRCGPLSPACERFFVQEACFYECSPHIGLYRKFGGHACNDSQCSTTYNATCDPYSVSYKPNAGCSDAHNTWQVHKMPIRRDYCNAWFTACADDYFCANAGGSYFSCAEIPTKPNNTIIIIQQSTSESKSSKLSGQMVGLIIGLSVALVLLGLFTCCIVKREADGKPIFKPLLNTDDSKKRGGGEPVPLEGIVRKNQRLASISSVNDGFDTAAGGRPVTV